LEGQSQQPELFVQLSSQNGTISVNFFQPSPFLRNPLLWCSINVPQNFPPFSQLNRNRNTHLALPPTALQLCLKIEKGVKSEWMDQSCATNNRNIIPIESRELIQLVSCKIDGFCLRRLEFSNSSARLLLRSRNWTN
jgi:hypothetical protein